MTSTWRLLVWELAVEGVAHKAVITREKAASSTNARNVIIQQQCTLN
jgi:hypothetical protein